MVGLGIFDVNFIDLVMEGVFFNLLVFMDYVCNFLNCVFEKDLIGCVVVFGIFIMDEVGDVSIVYDIGVIMVVCIILVDVFFIFLNILFLGNYFLCVKVSVEMLNCEFLLVDNNDFSDWVV